VPVLFCSLELYLPDCHSLKEKRRVVRGTAERLRTKFKCSVSELDHQDLWQRSRIGVAVAGSDRAFLEMVSEKIRLESERLLGGDLVDFFAELLEHE
jgi:uncharacterized protein